MRGYIVVVIQPAMLFDLVIYQTAANEIDLPAGATYVVPRTLIDLTMTFDLTIRHWPKPTMAGAEKKRGQPLPHHIRLGSGGY